jgi:adenylate cyclase
VQAGQPEIAIEHGETALRLSPRARVGSTFFMMGIAYFLSKRFEQAVPKLRLAIQENPTFAEPYRVLAACYAHMGQLDDAREMIARLRDITSVVMPDAIRYRKTEHRELLLSGLRLAVSSS